MEVSAGVAIRSSTTASPQTRPPGRCSMRLTRASARSSSLRGWNGSSARRDARTEIVMLRAPGGGTGLELSRFVRPDHHPGSPTAMANELGLRSVAFEIDDLHAALDRLAVDGYGLVGGVGRYENAWLMAY